MFKRSKEIQVEPYYYNDERYHIVLRDITTLQPKGILKKYSVVKNVKDITPCTVESDYRSQAIDIDTNECVEFYGYERSNIRLDKLLIENYDILNAKEREKYVIAAVKYEQASDFCLAWGTGMMMLALLSQIRDFESCTYALTAFVAIKIIRILISLTRLQKIKNAIILSRMDYEEDSNKIRKG